MKAVTLNWPPTTTLQKKSKRATGRHTGAYARYIRQVVVDRKLCKIGTETHVLSVITPLKHSVPYLVWAKLRTLKVEKSHTLMG